MLAALVASVIPARAAAAPVPVLVYHQIVAAGEAPGPTRITLEHFRAQMDQLAVAGYRTLDVDGLLSAMASGTTPERAVVVSFDDGWASQLDALEVLRERRQRAVLFVFPGSGVGDSWGNHLDWDDLAAVAAEPLFEVQAHTLTHPGEPDDNLLAWLEGRTPGRDREDVMEELRGSRALLETRLGTTVEAMAWPGGWYDGRLVALARDAGYRALFTIDEGGNGPGDDPMRIRRLLVHGACGPAAFLRMLAEVRHCDPAAGGD